MGLTRAERDRRERAAREAAWQAEEVRVRKLGELFDDLPEGHQKEALLDAMTDRIIDLYNNMKFEEGDAILEFLPNDVARSLLDWYFDEDGPDVAPNFRRSTWDERPCPTGVAGQPDGAQAEASSDAGTATASVEGEAVADQGSPGTAGCGTPEVSCCGSEVLER